MILGCQNYCATSSPHQGQVRWKHWDWTYMRWKYLGWNSARWWKSRPVGAIHKTYTMMAVPVTLKDTSNLRSKEANKECSQRRCEPECGQILNQIVPHAPKTRGQLNGSCGNDGSENVKVQELRWWVLAQSTQSTRLCHHYGKPAGSLHTRSGRWLGARNGAPLEPPPS